LTLGRWRACGSASICAGTCTPPKPSCLVWSSSAEMNRRPFRAEVRAALGEMIAEAAEVEVCSLDVESLRGLTLDSLTMVELGVRIEERYGVELRAG
jgi:hypothetical protein